MTHAINLADVIQAAARDYAERAAADPAGIRCSIHTLRYLVWYLHILAGNEPPGEVDPDTAQLYGLGFEIDNRIPFGEFAIIPAGVILG